MNASAAPWIGSGDRPSWVRMMARAAYGRAPGASGRGSSNWSSTAWFNAFTKPQDAAKLADRFGIPPFSVFNAREGWWQERKAAWLALGIQSELGRDHKPTSCATDWMKRGPEAEEGQANTSIFDPVLCEIAYQWFCPPGGNILDPFAGGSVRGIVASKLGRQYHGIDLSVPQVEANIAQAKEICGAPHPTWDEGDSSALDTWVRPESCDFVFSIDKPKVY